MNNKKNKNKKTLANLGAKAPSFKRECFKCAQKTKFSGTQKSQSDFCCLVAAHPAPKGAGFRLQLQHKKKQERTKISRFFSEKNTITLLALIVFSLAILIITPSIRSNSHNGLMSGPEPYYHARIAKDIMNNGLIKDDTLVFNGMPYAFNAYHLVLAGLSSLLGLKIALFTLPLATGMLCVLLFYLILSELRLKLIVKAIASFIFLALPVFIHHFTTLSDTSFIFFLQLLGVFLFMKAKNNLLRGLSLIVFFTICFFGTSHALITMAIVFALTLKNKQFKNLLYVYLIMIITSVILYFFIFSKSAINQEYYFSHLPLSGLIFIFGANAGLSLFGVLLALVGVLVNWKKKTFNFLLILFLGFLLTYSLYFDKAMLLTLGAFMSIPAGIAFHTIIKRKWEFKILRGLTILALLCGIMFSTLTYFKIAVHEQPTNEMHSSLIWLGENTKAGKTVFSHYDNGFWIQSMANNTVLLDSNIKSIPDVKAKIDDSTSIFYSRNLANTTELLKKYNIGYIYITPEMKKGIVWTEEEEGLRFLFRNKETFEKVYDKDNYEIWEYR